MTPQKNISNDTFKNEFQIEKLKDSAFEIRKKLLKMHYEVKSSHLGTGLSEVDLLTYAFGCFLKTQDRFVLSKGHGASGVYATLNHFGLMPEGLIETYYKDGTKLAAHPSPLALEHLPIATGSLGHGLSIAAGMALASQLKNKLETSIENKKCLCLISDGELNEGSIWEAALFAGHHKLNNLFVFVDFNGLQGFGRTEEVLNPEPVVQKWESFGFVCKRGSGHDFQQIHKSILDHINSESKKPFVYIAETIKGKGVNYMENTLDWHYLNMNEELYKKALDVLTR